MIENWENKKIYKKSWWLLHLLLKWSHEFFIKKIDKKIKNFLIFKIEKNWLLLYFMLESWYGYL